MVHHYTFCDPDELQDYIQKYVAFGILNFSALVRDDHLVMVKDRYNHNIQITTYEDDNHFSKILSYG